MHVAHYVIDGAAAQARLNRVQQTPDDAPAVKSICVHTHIDVAVGCAITEINGHVGAKTGAGFEALHPLLDPRDVDHIPWVMAAGVIGFAGNELVAAATGSMEQSQHKLRRELGVERWSGLSGNRNALRGGRLLGGLGGG